MHFRGGFYVPSLGRRATPKSRSLTEHGALPRRARRDRSGGLPRPRRVLARSGAGLRRPDRGAGRLGCTYLQLDDTSLAYLNDPAQRAYVTGIGGDGEHQHVTYIRHINAALARKPAGMRVCTHMCRGNFKSSWVATGGYEHVAEALFTS